MPLDAHFFGAALSKSIEPPLEIEDMSTMNSTAQGCLGQSDIAKEFGPAAELQVRGEIDALPLVTSGGGQKERRHVGT